MLEIVPDDAPSVLMLTPAGQVSYIGMNDRGLAGVANYVSPELRSEERATPAYVANSQTRMGRIRELAAERNGRLDVAGAQELLRDRTCYPDTLCREPEDSPGRDVMTFASLVAVSANRELWIAVGPPNQHEYQRHTFSA